MELHVASGESWGSHQHSLEKGTADAHGALGSVVGSRRVCGQGQSVGTILPAPLFEGGLSRQALSRNATGKTSSGLAEWVVGWYRALGAGRIVRSYFTPHWR